MASAGEVLDDDQAPTAMRTRQCERAGLVVTAIRTVGLVLASVRRLGLEQVPDSFNVRGTPSIAEEAIVPDAVLAFREHVDEETADELIWGQRHGGVSVGALYAVILDSEGDTLRVGSQQAAVRDGNAMGVS